MTAVLLAGTAQTVSAQRITASKTFEWASTGAWAMPFTPGRPGEVVITIHWTKPASPVMGVTVPQAWGISLTRDVPASNSMVKALPTASTPGDASGTVTLKYNMTAADLAAGTAWLAVPLTTGRNDQDFKLDMSVTYPIAPAAAPVDLAVIDANLSGAGAAPMLKVNLRNAGQKAITQDPATVECHLDSFLFLGWRADSLQAWQPGATVGIALKLYNGAVIDPGKNTVVGANPITCFLRSYYPRKDYYPDNDTLKTQITIAAPAASQFAFDVQIDDCNQTTTFVAGKRACAHLNWTNAGAGFDGGFSATCTQGGQQSVVAHTARIQYGEAGKEDFDPGPLAAGQHFLICKLLTGGGTSLQSTNTFNVQPPIRYDLAMGKMARTIQSTADGKTYFDVELRNDGTTTTAYALDCNVAGYHYTEANQYLPLGGGTHRLQNAQSLASLPEGVQQVTCMANVTNAGATDANPANNTMTSPVRITHAGHELYVQIADATASLETNRPVHNYPGSDGLRIDESMLRIEVAIYEHASHNFVFRICLKDAVGNDLSSNVTAEPIRYGGETLDGKPYFMPVTTTLISWTDASMSPPSQGIIHVEVWDTAAPPPDAACNATTDPAASSQAPPKTALWSVAEFPTAFAWRMADKFVKPGIGDRRISGLSPVTSSATDTTPPPKRPPRRPIIEKNPGVPPITSLKPPLEAPVTEPAKESVACDGGCFDANVSGDHTATMNGHAAVQIDVVDTEMGGGDFKMVLTSGEDEGHYVSFGRFGAGGRPRAGVAYVIANSCDEEGAENNKRDQFTAEYWVNAFHEGEVISYNGKTGTLTIDQITPDRILGHFSVVACRWKTDGTRVETRLRGRFNALFPH